MHAKKEDVYGLIIESLSAVDANVVLSGVDQLLIVL